MRHTEEKSTMVACIRSENAYNCSMVLSSTQFLPGGTPWSLKHGPQNRPYRYVVCPGISA